MVFLEWGCASGSPAQYTGAAEASSGGQAALSWNIVDYKDKAVGGQIPPWVSAWLEGNGGAEARAESRAESRAEALEEYQDRRVFIAANSGTHFNALSQWQEGFSPELDFARLAAIRIERRFLGAARKYPDDEYGSFFQTLIRAASDAEWRGCVREDAFWVKREYPGADGVQTDRESWDFLILVTVEKDTLAAQINALIQNTKPEFPITRDQAQAVNRVREQFFDGF
jgi:hypothetical protein